MTDINASSSSTPGTSEGSNTSKPADEAVSALKSSVLADAHDLADGAKHVAGDVVAQARDSAQAQVTGGKDRLANSLGSVAEAIRHTGQQLREGDESSLTEYVARAANGVEAASEYLKEKSIGDVLGDVGSFARREPAMFLGGAFVLGLLGGRFLKSSDVRPTRNGGNQRAEGGRTKQLNGGQTRQGKSPNTLAPRSKSTSSAQKKTIGERLSDTGGDDTYDDGATLLGGV